MPLRRQRRNRLRAPGLNNDQRCVLETGLSLGEQGFSSRAEMEKSWWAHRATLMAESRPLSRPYSFWEFEVGSYHPGCKKNGYEKEIDAVIRLGLLLTPQERNILTAEAPRHFPAVVPAAGIEHWSGVLRSIETRAEWHRREGRHEQAGLWREAFVLLHARIEVAEGKETHV